MRPIPKSYSYILNGTQKKKDKIPEINKIRAKIKANTLNLADLRKKLAARRLVTQ